MTGQAPSRRALLQGLGLGAAAVPLLPGLGRVARAEGTGFPTRLVVVVYPNGVHHDSFWPKGDGQSPTQALTIDGGPDSSLAPLKPFESRLLVVGGLYLKNMYEAGAAWSHSSTPFVLTAAEGAPFEGAWDGMQKTAGGPSLDLHVAAGLAAQGVKTKLRSLVLRTGDYRGNDGYLSVTGPPVANKINAPTPETDPVRVFETLFSDLDPNGVAAAQAQRRALDRSVLDYLARSLPRLKNRVGAAHATRIDEHLDGVRELERRLMSEPTTGCNAPDAPSDASLKAGEVRYLPAIGRQFSKLTVAALRCDLVRVACIGWTGAPYQFTFPTTGEAKVLDADTSGPYMNEHGVAHEVSRGPEAVRRKILVDRWFARELATLLTDMDAVKEGDGTMLDHSIVVFTNEMADGYWHSASDMPYVIAGGGNGAVRGGRLVRWAGGSAYKNYRSHAGLLMDLSLAMGVPVEGLNAAPGSAAFGTLK